MSRADRHIRAGRALRDRLQAEGRHMDAETVQHLILSMTAGRATLSMLHKDNMALRRQLGLPAFEVTE